ncbi:MAG TPA: glycerophosphoryl diester phosphodiesterase membrane domain-containing protein [Terriglobales bacterium]|nr:glycerophosphoryl diester phosphodiesterase membrane domain-containing protein [Terriglobales bacterium]
MASELRPLGLGELLDRTFFLYRNHFLLFVGILALPNLILLAFQLAGVALHPGRIATFPLTTFIWSIATAIVGLGVAAAAQGGTVIAVSHVHLGRSTSISEAFAGMKGRIIYLALLLIGTWFLIALIFGIPTLIGFAFRGFWVAVFAIPGIVAAIYFVLNWALTVPVAVLEDTSFFESLRRSSDLVKGSRGRVFVIYFLFLVLFYAVVMAWEFPILFFLGTATQHHRNIETMLLWTRVAIPVCTFLTSILVGPLMTIGLSLLYYDLRVRKEAFDIQHMMATLDGSDHPVPSPI